MAGMVAAFCLLYVLVFWPGDAFTQARWTKPTSK